MYKDLHNLEKEGIQREREKGVKYEKGIINKVKFWKGNKINRNKIVGKRESAKNDEWGMASSKIREE